MRFAARRRSMPTPCDASARTQPAILQEFEALMLTVEAKWLAQEIERLKPQRISPMLNVGSQSAEFRTHKQPWIDQFIFRPLRRQGVVVQHLDLQDVTGVDIVGDLTDTGFQRTLAEMKFRSIMCCNLLEHVSSRQEIADIIASIVSPGGYVFVTCPYQFPYHPDPIDTMYRPSTGELAALFKGTRIVRQENLACGTMAGYVWKRVRTSRLELVRGLWHRPTLPRGCEERGGSLLRFVPWFFRSFRQSCLVLQKLTGP